MPQAIISTNKLKVTKQIKDGICYLAYSGDIDEDYVYDELLKDKQTKYLIDFNEIEMINSCGIREWIGFIEKLGPEARIIYINCPQIIVQQINMVEGFMTPNSYVHSFFAPYYCEELDLEKKILLKAEDVVDFKAPVVHHEGHEMEFDAHEKQYFHFLTLQRKPF